MCVHIEEIWIFQEFSWESSKDQEVLIVSLSNTCSLSVCEKFWRNCNNFPFASVWSVIFLNWVDVLSGLICNTTEDKNVLIIKSTWAVIMSTNIEIWHFEPKIDVWVVHFTFYLGWILLFSWPSNNNELISKPACWMTVSWMLHLISLNKSEIVLSLNFPHWIKCVFILLVVTTTNHE